MQYVCGQMSRAAQKRNPGRGSQRLHRALGGTRILLAAAPTAPPCFCRWQRSSLLHRGFPPPDYSAGRCCSNPPLQPLFKADKTETPVPGSDTGVLGGRVWIARAALLKTAHWAVFALSSATAPQLFESTRPMSLALLQNKNLSVLAYAEAFWWARVDYASRAAKNSPLGCFYAVFCDSAAAVRIHPPYEFSLVTKQKPQRTCIR